MHFQYLNIFMAFINENIFKLYKKKMFSVAYNV